jgi:hypothetical protein
MPYYRLYIYGNRGRISQAFPLDCDSDEAALETAMAHSGPFRMELWQEGRLVAAIPKDDPAPD